MKGTINVGKAMQGINRAAKQGVAEAAQVVEMMAVQRAPIRTGQLRNSVSITPGLIASGVYTQTISFRMIYAAVQHERTDFNHPRGGQAKYLSSVLDEEQARIKAIFENHLKGAL